MKKIVSALLVSLLGFSGLCFAQVTDFDANNASLSKFMQVAAQDSSIKDQTSAPVPQCTESAEVYQQTLDKFKNSNQFIDCENKACMDEKQNEEKNASACLRQMKDAAAQIETDEQSNEVNGALQLKLDTPSGPAYCVNSHSQGLSDGAAVGSDYAGQLGDPCLDKMRDDPLHLVCGIALLPTGLLGVAVGAVAGAVAGTASGEKICDDAHQEQSDHWHEKWDQDLKTWIWVNF